MANQTTPAIQIKDSNVGIGTTTPAAKLTVSGAGVEAHINNGDTNTLTLGNFSSGRHFIKSINLGVALTPLTLQASAFTFDTGNVLIGTTTDAGYKLDVNGSARIQGNSYVTSRNYISLAGDLPVAYKIPYTQLAGGTVVSDNLANGGSAKVAYSTGTPGTFFFGPYSSIEPGSYVAKFRLKVASNASSSSIGAIDVAGANIASNSLLLRPSMFPTSGEYYYFSVPFTVGPAASSSLETRWLNWPGGVTDAYVDHVFIESAQSEAEVYVPSNKDFNVYADGTSRMVVKNSGNVGIGTTSPTFKLDVNGNIRTQTGYIQGANSNADITIDGNTGSVLRYGNQKVLLNSSDAYIYTANVARLFINNAGNVGIGTTSPSYLLDVNGSGRIGSGIGTGVYVGNSSHAVWTRAGGTNGNMALYSGGSDRITIVGDNGNVGIGTTAPSSKFEVYDTANSNTFTITSDGANEQFRIRRYSNTNEQLIIGFHSSDYGYIQTVEQAVAYRPLSLNPNGGNVGIGTTAPGFKLDVSGTFHSGGDATFNGTNTYINSSYIYVGNNTADLVSISGNTMYFPGNGNVGIGTTSPNSKLEVTGGIASTFGSTNGYIALQAGNSTVQGYIEWFKPNPTRVAYMGYNDGVSANNLGLTLENSANFVINGGNVGIGTTSPAYQLTLNKNDNNYLQIRSSDTGAAGIYFGRQNDSVRGSIYYDNNADALYFQTNNLTTNTVITSAGNVGIGTTSPAQKLDISQGSIFLSGSGSKYLYIRRYDGLGTHSFGVGSDEKLILSLSGSNPFIIDGGNVGIGTTSPAQKLDVSGGDIILSSNATYIRSKDTSGNTPRMFGINPSNDTYIGPIDPYAGGAVFYGVSANVSSQTFYTGASARLHINSAGNVGIGTTTPTRSLSVAGGIIRVQSGTSSTTGQIDFGNADTYFGYYNNVFQARTWDGFDYYEAFRIDGANHNLILSTSEGNVGVGTTSPAYKLDVVGTTRSTTFLSTNATGSTGLQITSATTSGNGAVIRLTKDAADRQVYQTFEADQLYLGVPASNTTIGEVGTKGSVDLRFATAYSERMRITAGGNVGIGTTSPSTLLNVMTATNAVDVLRLDNSGGNSGSVQGVTHLAINHFGTGTNPSTRITAYQDGVSGWPGGMYFSTRSLNTDSAPVERMRITSAGNVGIGTSSPQYMLDVNGDAQINAPGTGPAYAYQPDGGFGVDSLITSGVENVALGKPDIWLRIHVDGVAFVFPGYQE